MSPAPLSSSLAGDHLSPAAPLPASQAKEEAQPASHTSKDQMIHSHRDQLMSPILPREPLLSPGMSRDSLPLSPNLGREGLPLSPSSPLTLTAPSPLPSQQESWEEEQSGKETRQLAA